jgi:hypothetical protein
LPIRDVEARFVLIADLGNPRTLIDRDKVKALIAGGSVNRPYLEIAVSSQTQARGAIRSYN